MIVCWYVSVIDNNYVGLDGATRNEWAIRISEMSVRMTSLSF